MEIATRKQNELNHQQRRYGRMLENLQPGNFAQLVTPIHRGGNLRGSLRRAAFERLIAYPIAGKRILDYACGAGDFSNELARRGAVVSAFDVSPNAIEVAKKRANHAVDWRVMDAERLDFATDEFDYVFGVEALHHVIILPNMPAELARVCKGPIIFAENWGADNPLFALWRRNTTLKTGHSDERGEVILGRKMLDHYLSAHFSTIKVTPLSLTYMLKKYMKLNFILRGLYAVDQALLRALPLGDFCGESVIELHR